MASVPIDIRRENSEDKRLKEEKDQNQTAAAQDKQQLANEASTSNRAIGFGVATAVAGSLAVAALVVESPLIFVVGTATALFSGVGTLMVIF